MEIRLWITFFAFMMCKMMYAFFAHPANHRSTASHTRIFYFNRSFVINTDNFFSIFYISFIPSNHKLIILFSQIRHYYVNNQNLNIK